MSHTHEVENVDTPWHATPFRARAPQLMFGRTYEDSAIELEAFAPRSRVFCIAGAGCTARILAAAGHQVTAVDIHPEQVAYARSRAFGAPERAGAAEHLVSYARRFFGLVGWTEQRLGEFLYLNDPVEQISYWDRFLSTRRLSAALDVVLSRSILHRVYNRSFVDALPPNFATCIHQRMRRCWATHPNASNPYAWNFFSGQQQIISDPPVRPIHFACVDAATYLESCGPASFEAFSLSNILDGAPAGYADRLHRAVRRAAVPGAVLVSRSFAEPVSEMKSNWAGRDRSFLWGIVSVTSIGGPSPCDTC
jgi:S-adenosylmethionine:diacylglycerol 3-amino-3-carboxypropyl transferase